ncbi:MAG: hypothetical protein J7621_17685 [Niastella sp.]|nr:hypothetical protein [Niastella sp.]
MRILSFVLFAFMLLGMTCRNPEGDKWMLKPAGEPSYVITEVAIPDVAQPIPDTIITGFRLRQYGSVTKGNVVDSLLMMEAVFEQLQRTERFPVFSIAGQPANSMEKIYQDMRATHDSCRQGVIGDSVSFYCDRGGQGVWVKGADGVVQKIALATGKDGREVYGSLRDMFSTTVLQDLFTRILFYFPPSRRVKVGDSWVNNYVLKAKAPVKYSNIITVKGILGDTVMMSVKAAVSVWTGEGGRIFAQGTQEGTITASLYTGLPYHFSLEDKMVTKTDADEITSRHIFTVRRQ